MEIQSVSARAALRVTLIVFLVVIALRFLWIAHAIFVVTFLGILVGLAVARAADLLERVHIRRSLGAPLVVFLSIGIVAGAVALALPSVREQTQELTRELPKSLDKVEQWMSRTPAKALVGGGGNPQSKDGLRGQLTKEMRGATRFFFPIVSSVFGAVGGVIIVLFIAMYIGATPGLYRKGLLHLVPHHLRDRAEETLTTLRDTLRQWLVARLIAMVLIGIITGVGLALLKVNGAVALGVLAGLLEFVPFFGPVASAIPALGVALVDSPQKALWVAALYTLVQQLEGNLITPLLLEKRLDIPPVLTIVGVAAMGMVFGVIGMLIAEPLLAVVLVTTKMLYVQDVVGDEVKVGKQTD